MKQLFLFLSLSSVISFSQIPSSWLGEYSGELTSVNPKNDTARYAMGLTFEALTDTSWKFHIRYGEGERSQIRPYTLFATDKSYKYLLDENNGIVLTIMKFGNTLSSVFEVSGSLIDARYSFDDEVLRFSLVSSTKADTTGLGTEEIPTVQNYMAVAFQSAQLKKLP